MKYLNLGILAHVDAGKTSLTERLLYTAGVIDQIGSVDAGNTQTDSLQLERQRGITIKSAVASFDVGDTRINLIDTPGHPDFIAEVERVLRVLDGAVLVISAVEGVQPQTRVLMRALQRLKVPALIFVNKIDRVGARYNDLLTEIADKLSVELTPMGTVKEIGLPDADFIRRKSDVSPINTSQACPVFFGSAITGAGIESLMEGLTESLPTKDRTIDASVTGTVFKIERGPKGEKIAYVSLITGVVQARKQLAYGQGKQSKVTAIEVFKHGTVLQKSSLAAGEIGKVRGLTEVQIGDTIGATGKDSQQYFALPTLQTTVMPRHINDTGKLRLALDQLAEQDPLINVRQDDKKHEIYISLYGEVQKQVIEATLANDYGIAVTFAEVKPICVERLIKSGEAVEFLRRNGNPFLATVGIRIEPAATGPGVQVKITAPLESLPLYVYKSVPAFEESFRQYAKDALQHGLYGWQIVDALITLTTCGYESPGSTAGDFRKLTQVVLASAVKQAGTKVCEPICYFDLETPTNCLNRVLTALEKLGGAPQTTTMRDSVYAIGGYMSAARIHDLQKQLPSLTNGEGYLEYEFRKYETRP